MRKKNWIEFSNLNNFEKFNNKDEIIDHPQKIKVYSQKKCKGGKSITLITGLKFEDKTHKKELLKKLKIYCSTGGKLYEEGIQLQGVMVDKVIFFLRKEGYEL
tara:strand:- start:1041 stop:1349 length:309 start_codon:yes stop_codon:yes gene_type:complete